MQRMLFIASAMGIALLASGTAQAAHRTGEVTADKAKPAQNIMEMARRGRGRDDAPGDDRGSGGNGADDGAGHT